MSLFTAVFIFMALPNVAYASANSGTANAVQDIMNHDRFQGAVETIEFITTRIDWWFTAAISAISFFIISAALLKNACAGAYVANQKFWNNVAEAHEAMDASKLAGVFQKGGMQNFMSSLGNGGIKNFLLCLIPNIKAMTDFDDTDIEPKTYFMKAIPQMLACIIIGVFIYNGYYRDTAATVGSFGSEICNRLFASVDPVTFVDKITQTTTVPESIYANDPTLQGKAILKLSQELYKTFLSESKNLTDMEAKTSLMRDCEKLAYDLLNEDHIKDKFFSDSRKYDFAISNVKVTAVPSNATQEKIGKAASVTLIDTQTQSEYSIKAFRSAPNTAAEYVPKSKAYAYVSLVMKGSQRSDEAGETNILAESGSWGAGIADQVNVTYKPTNSNTQDNKTTYKGNISCEEIFEKNRSAIEASARKAINNASGSQITLDLASFNNTTAQRGMMNITGLEEGKEIQFNIRFRATFTVKGASGDNAKETQYVTVPVKCTLGE